MRCFCVQVFIFSLQVICDVTSSKKVVILGEMSDHAFRLASDAASSSLDGGSFHLDEELTHDLHPLRQLSHVPSGVRKKVTRLTGSGSAYTQDALFVPVSRYSGGDVSAGGGGGVGVGGGEDDDRAPASHMNRRMPSSISESTAFRYSKKPNIIQYGGQYLYAPSKSIGSSFNPIVDRHTRHHLASSLFAHPSSSPPLPPTFDSPHFYSPYASDLHTASSSHFSSPSSSSSAKSGLGPGGLLLATLPLILAPALSYIFTPLVIPVTAAIAGAGRKRKRRSTINHLHLTVNGRKNFSFTAARE